MSQETDPFVLVVERLKCERDEMDRTIALLEARISRSPPPTPDEGKPEAEKEDDRERGAETPKPSGTEGEFLGITVAAAARVVLTRRRKPMSPANITIELVRGGLLTANSRTVASILHRRSRDVGDFVRPKRGLWGLKEWYPRRSFGKAEGSDKGEATEPSATVLPSEPTLIVPLRTTGEP